MLLPACFQGSPFHHRLGLFSRPKQSSRLVIFSERVKHIIPDLPPVPLGIAAASKITKESPHFITLPSLTQGGAPNEFRFSLLFGAFSGNSMGQTNRRFLHLLTPWLSAAKS
jgi:hypothetical protein